MADINARHYKKNSSLQTMLAKDIFSLHAFQKNESILDLGCGDGRLSYQLAQRVPEGSVLAIDPSPSMIDLASSSFPPEKHLNLRFALAAIDQFSFEDNFDLITAFSSLHWIFDQENALKYMKKQLRPNGKLLILIYPKESPYWRLLEETINTKKYQQYAASSICHYWISTDRYRQIIDELGLKVLHFNSSKEAAHYKGIEHFKDYVKGWIACFVSLPDHLEEKYLIDLAIHALEKYGKKGRIGFSIPYQKAIFYVQC